MSGKAFTPFDFDTLQSQANDGELDFVLAFTADGQVTAYGPGGDEFEGEPLSYGQVVTGPLVYACYLKCSNHKLYSCYIDGNGNEKCSDTGRSC